MIKWITITLYSTLYPVTEDDLRQLYNTGEYLFKFNDNL
jgi:hypothetical protein